LLLEVARPDGGRVSQVAAERSTAQTDLPPELGRVVEIVLDGASRGGEMGRTRRWTVSLTAVLLIRETASLTSTVIRLNSLAQRGGPAPSDWLVRRSRRYSDVIV